MSMKNLLKRWNFTEGFNSSYWNCVWSVMFIKNNSTSTGALKLIVHYYTFLRRFVMELTNFYNYNIFLNLILQNHPLCRRRCDCWQFFVYFGVVGYFSDSIINGQLQLTIFWSRYNRRFCLLPIYLTLVPKKWLYNIIS